MRSIRGIVLLAAAVVVLRTPMAHAQLELSVQLEHAVLICHEPAYAILTVRNESDLPFVIASDEEDQRARVYLSIDAGRQQIAVRKDFGPLVSSLTLLPGDAEQLRINMGRFYDLGKMQGYTVMAVAEWNGKQYRSALARFDVVNGLPLVEVTRGLPGDSEHMRRYALRYLTRDRSEHLFLCVDEDEGLVPCGVFDLGPLVRVSLPRLTVDRSGTVTVFHQSGNGVYTKTTLESSADRVAWISQTQEGGNVRLQKAMEAPGGASAGGKSNL